MFVLENKTKVLSNSADERENRLNVKYKVCTDAAVSSEAESDPSWRN